jgi:hypothetical protein
MPANRLAGRCVGVKQKLPGLGFRRVVCLDTRAIKVDRSVRENWEMIDVALDGMRDDDHGPVDACSEITHGTASRREIQSIWLA